MNFGLIVIGDEILHSRREDAHFPFFKQLLGGCGLRLGWVRYLPDDRRLLTAELAASFAAGGAVFVTGGIGGTPDDHTRQAAAAALQLPLLRHPEAEANIQALSLSRGDALDSPAHLARLNMADFPAGSGLVPNPYNNIAGFFIREHYFLPGFPVMAHPMAEWVIKQFYSDTRHRTARAQRAVRLFGLPESAITALMEHIESAHAGIRTFSLPSVSAQQDPAYILFGLKAEGEAACAVLDTIWQQTLAALHTLGGHTEPAADDL